MGHSFFGTSGPASAKKSYSLQVCRQLECKICPLNRIEENEHPHMEPTGSKKPVVYVLGEAPGETEDEENEQFVGVSGRVLRCRIPEEWEDKIRWNNVVRTRPRKNATPTAVEIECCRPSVERDIAASKPTAIFAFGAVPLSWGPKISSGINMWRGRKTPVEILGHRTWFYVFHHPSYIHRQKKFDKSPSTIGSEAERAFEFDLQRAFAEIEHLPEPDVYTPERCEEGLEILDGSRGDLERLEELINWACEQKEAGVDYETYGTRPYDTDAKLLTIAVSTKSRGFAFAYDHPDNHWSDEDKRQVKKLWLKFLRSKCRKLVHFLNFEMEWTAYYFGWDLLHGTKWGGSESQAIVLDERTGKEKRKTKQGPLQLDFLSKQYFGLNIKLLSPLNKKDLRKEPIKEVLRYNAIDAKFHYLIFKAQRYWLKHYNLMAVYKMMVRRTPTVVLTQLKGVPVNLKITSKFEAQYTKDIDAAEKEIFADKDVQRFIKKHGKYNPASNHDVVKFYRDFMKFREGYTEGKFDEETGKRKERYAVDKEVLKKIDHPTCDPMLRLREAEKKLSTYCYHKHIWPDGLIHANFNTIFTTTSRLSCDNPNLQNIPKRNEEARKLRRQIEASVNHSIVAIDYGQIEWRVIAMITKSKMMVKALWEKFDVHGYWTERIAKGYPEVMDRHSDKKDPFKSFRDVVKNNFVFASCFGSTLDSIVEKMDIPEYVLGPEYKLFQKDFAEVMHWHKKLNRFYQDHGYVETMGGFRRRAPMSYNKIINAPIQGTAAEIVTNGMYEVSKYAHETEDWYFQPIINIHDDLTYHWPDDKIHEYARPVIDRMISVPYDYVNVPIVLEMSIGKNMYDMGVDKEKDTMVISSDEWKVVA